MSASIACQVPAQVAAGDTLQWRRPGGAYPASEGWTLNYAIVGVAGKYSAQAAADGDDYLVTVTSETSAQWLPGVYQVQEFVTQNDLRFTLGTSTLKVTPNLVDTAAGIDTRSHAQKVLESINEWFESSAPVAGNFEINGRKISYYPLVELLALRDRYRLEVSVEQGARRGRNRILAVL